MLNGKRYILVYWTGHYWCGITASDDEHYINRAEHAWSRWGYSRVGVLDTMTFNQQSR